MDLNSVHIIANLWHTVSSKIPADVRDARRRAAPTLSMGSDNYRLFQRIRHIVYEEMKDTK